MVPVTGEGADITDIIQDYSQSAPGSAASGPAHALLGVLQEQELKAMRETTMRMDDDDFDDFDDDEQ